MTFAGSYTLPLIEREQFAMTTTAGVMVIALENLE